MNIQFRFLLACSIALTLSACGSSDNDTNTAADGSESGNTDTGTNTTGDSTSSPPGDDTSAGDTSGGDTSGGDTSGGDTIGGDTTGGDTSGGDTTGGDTTGDSTGDGGTVVGNARYYGGITISDNALSNNVSLGAGFGRFGFDVPVSQLEQELNGRDTCEVTESGVGGGSELPSFDNIGTTFQLVGAGDVIPFTTASGTFAELKRVDQFGFITYTPDGDVLGPIPTGLSVTVPGDVFPAFPNVLVPEVTRVQWFGPGQGEIITPDSTMSWQPGVNPDAVVTMTAFSLPQPGSATSIVWVSCQMADDGSFTFPPETKTAMGAGFAAGGPPSISRRVDKIVPGNNAVLMISREAEGIAQ